MLITADEYLDNKERISAMIFDYEYDTQPDEESCNEIAENILEFLGFTAVGE